MANLESGLEELRREVDELLAEGRVDDARAALATLQTAARAKALTGRLRR